MNDDLEKKVLNSVHHKFSGMNPFMPENSYFLYDSVDNIDNKNSFLLEACLYENDKAHFFLTNSKQKFLKKFDKNQFYIINHSKPEKISFSFVYNKNESYKLFLDKAKEHYSNLNLPFKTEIVLYEEEEETFDMSRARNLSLKKTKFEHVFMLDLDCYLSEEEIIKIMDIWCKKKHCGIFNLKPHFSSGNGWWFGKKNILKKNGYSEKFKKFWCEDTEYFLNFSRIGFLPMVVFCNAQIIDHPRVYTNKFVGINDELFKNIFQGIVDR